MTDHRRPVTVPTPDPAVLGHLTRVGAGFAVAGEDGFCLELRTKAVQGDVVVASARSDRLEAGARVSARAYDGTRALAAVFLVEEAERAGRGRSDVLLRLVDVIDCGDERRSPRLEVVATGTLTVVESFAAAPERRPTPLTVVEASASGLSFVVGRALEPGETLDVAFGDGTGATIRCRAITLRAERAVQGRTRYAARITAIGELDRLRLGHMLTRAGHRQEAAAAEVEDRRSLRELLVAGRGEGPLRRLLGRG